MTAPGKISRFIRDHGDSLEIVVAGGLAGTVVNVGLAWALGMSGLEGWKNLAVQTGVSGAVWVTVAVAVWLLALAARLARGRNRNGGRQIAGAVGAAVLAAGFAFPTAAAARALEQPVAIAVYALGVCTTLLMGWAGFRGRPHRAWDLVARRRVDPLLRRAGLGTLTGAVLLVAVGALLPVERAVSLPPRRARPDAPSLIVLVTVDTLRADAASPSPPADGLMPNLHALAEDGIRFLEARSPSSWTRPAMTSLMTGLHPLTHGNVEMTTRLPGTAETLAERLRERGYVTFGIGRNSHLMPVYGFDQGFDGYSFYPHADSGSHGLTAGSLLRSAIAGRDSLPGTDELTAMGIETLETLAPVRPLFLWLHYFDPHAPYRPPDKYVADLPAAAEVGDSVDEEMVRGLQSGVVKLEAADRSRVRDLYEAEARHVDANLGALLDHLRDRQLYDDALIVVTSDHGEEFWEHGHTGHGHTLYDELIRVPLIVKLPRAPVAGLSVATPVTTSCLMATILEQAGARPPSLGDAGCDRSLSVHWMAASGPADAASIPPGRVDDEMASGTGGERGLHDPVYSTSTLYFEEQAAVVFRGWKYIRWLDSDREALFRLDDDPGERISIAGGAGETRATLLEARRLLDEYRARTSAAAFASNAEIELEPDVAAGLRSLGYIQ